MVEDVDTLFHTYAMDWLPDRVEASVDGKLYFTFPKPAEASVDKWPFDARFHLLLNIAIGGQCQQPHPLPSTTQTMRRKVHLALCVFEGPGDGLHVKMILRPQ